MAKKLLTTDNKRWIATVGLAIAGWFALVMSGNPLNLPALPTILSTPIIFGFSLVTVAGIVALLTIFLIWTEY